jgi:hypothetical protein
MCGVCVSTEHEQRENICSRIPRKTLPDYKGMAHLTQQLLAQPHDQGAGEVPNLVVTLKYTSGGTKCGVSTWIKEVLVVVLCSEPTHKYFVTMV